MLILGYDQFFVLMARCAKSTPRHTPLKQLPSRRRSLLLLLIAIEPLRYLVSSDFAKIGRQKCKIASILPFRMACSASGKLEEIQTG